MKELNSTQFIEACRHALRNSEENPEAVASEIAFNIALVRDAHPMLHLVRSIAWGIQELGLDDPTIEIGKEFSDIQTLLKRYENNDWLETKWSIFYTYSVGKDHSVSVAVHADTGGYVIETNEAELKKAVEKAIKKINRKQTNEWFIKSCSKVAPRSVGKFKYSYSDVSQSLATIR